MNFLAQQLSRLGLSTLEAQVYVALLERQLTTAGALAKHAGIKRSTVYTLIDSLLEKGLVSATQKDGVKHYQAESVNRLDEWIARQKRELEKKEGVLASMKKDLEKLRERKLQAPRVQIFEGQEGVNSLLMKNLDEEPSEILVLGGYMSEEDHIPDYTQRRIEMGIPTRVIIPDSPFARLCKKKDSKENRKSTLLGKKYQFPSSIHIYDRSLSIFTYMGKAPVGVYIENADICTSMKMVFELLSEQDDRSSQL